MKKLELNPKLFDSLVHSHWSQLSPDKIWYILLSVHSGLNDIESDKMFMLDIN